MAIAQESLTNAVLVVASSLAVSGNVCHQAADGLGFPSVTARLISTTMLAIVE